MSRFGDAQEEMLAGMRKQEIKKRARARKKDLRKDCNDLLELLTELREQEAEITEEQIQRVVGLAIKVDLKVNKRPTNLTQALGLLGKVHQSL